LIVNDQRIVTHAGGTFKVGDDGRQWPQHSGRGTGTPDDFPHDLRCYWVTFACVLLDTELWRALDGLREDFWYGYEDVDFCLRARPHGTHPIVAHGAVVEHGEFGTRTGVEDRQNQETFADLWPAAELDATLAGGL
jgi:GT2 family glycosyltransferase